MKNVKREEVISGSRTQCSRWCREQTSFHGVSVRPSARKLVFCKQLFFSAQVQVWYDVYHLRGVKMSQHFHLEFILKLLGQTFKPGYMRFCFFSCWL